MYPLIIFIFAVFVSVFFNTYLPITNVFPKLHTPIGLFVMAVSLIFLLIGYLHFITRRTTFIHGRIPKKLITTGFYIYSRNPLYLCITVFLIGLSVLLGGLTAFAGPFIFILIIHIVVIPREEKILETIFKEKYTNYKNHVPRWI